MSTLAATELPGFKGKFTAKEMAAMSLNIPNTDTKIRFSIRSEITAPHITELANLFVRNYLDSRHENDEREKFFFALGGFSFLLNTTGDFLDRFDVNVRLKSGAYVRNTLGRFIQSASLRVEPEVFDFLGQVAKNRINNDVLISPDERFGKSSTIAVKERSYFDSMIGTARDQARIKWLPEMMTELENSKFLPFHVVADMFTEIGVAISLWDRRKRSVPMDLYPKREKQSKDIRQEASKKLLDTVKYLPTMSVDDIKNFILDTRNAFLNNGSFSVEELDEYRELMDKVVFLTTHIRPRTGLWRKDTFQSLVELDTEREAVTLVSDMHKVENVERLLDSLEESYDQIRPGYKTTTDDPKYLEKTYEKAIGIIGLKHYKLTRPIWDRLGVSDIEEEKPLLYSHLLQ